MNKKKRDLTEHLLNALIYDGAHHKQHYVYQALLVLYGTKENIYKIIARDYNLTVEEYIKEFGEFDEGIPA